MKMTFHAIVALAAVLLSPFALASGDAAAGKTNTAVCAACHGQDGNSPTGAFPKLAGLGEKYLTKQMLDIQSGSRNVPEMTGMLNTLSKEDIANIAAYYNGQSRQLSGAQENDQQLVLGEQIFRAGNLETGVPACTGCHSPTGSGNTPAGYPALGGQHAQYIAKQLRAFRTGAHDAAAPAARLNDESKIMRGVTARMNDQEIDAVSNYISGLR